MEPLVHAVTLVSASAVSALLSAIWEGSALAVCALICLRLLPRLSAASRSVVWMSVFLLVVLLHIVPSFTGHESAANPANATVFHFDLRWSMVIAAVWAMLSAWRGAQLVMSAVRLHRLARRATPVVADPALLSILRDESGQGRKGRAAELCTSAEVERPCVFGFFRPRILIPPVLAEELSSLELQQVVLHEMEHLRRSDDWTNLLQKMALALFPLNPVLLWVERRLCAERELACDDRVLRSSGACKAYAVCLTRLAEYSMVRRSLSLVLGAWERQPELVRRVHRLLRGPRESMSGRQAAILTGSLIAVVLSGAIALARSPQLVSFTQPAQTSSQVAAEPRANLRETGGAPMLVKAVTPQQRIGSSVRSTHAAKPTVRRAVQRSVRRPYAESSQAWVVLTEWTESSAGPHVVLAVQQTISYEAIRVQNGWLIVQI